MSTITGLAVNNDKKNKTRSVLIIISVVLTAMLLTVIAVFCYGSIRSNRVNAKQLYGSFYGTYKGVHEEQIREMKRRSEFADIGKFAVAGEAENEKEVRLYWADEITRRLTNLDQYLEEGSFPAKDNEIAGDKSFFKVLGYENPRVGEKISLCSRPDSHNTYKTRQFVISGLLKENVTGVTKKTYAGYVSEEFYENQTAPGKENYYVYFRLNDTVRITSDGAEELLKELARKCGIDERNVSVNDYYLLWSLDPGLETVAGGVLIACCVILFSVAVIYNIFQVGIVQKIQEYGKLKALGATRKQVKRVVLLEGMLLSAIGVPIGLFTGCIVGKWVFSWLMDQSASLRAGAGLEKVSVFSFPVLCLVGAVSFLTVYLALRKPMKMVAKLSPVEAIRYQENTGKGQSLRKGKKYVTVKDMTLAGMAGNKKRTVTTICTMGLSCVLFVAIASFVGNVDNTYEARKSVEYGQFLIGLDYSLTDTAYPENNLDHILKADPLSSDLVAGIKQLPGVTGVKTRKILVLKETDLTGEKEGKLSSAAVLDREGFQNLKNNGGILGTVDYDTASEKNGMLYGWSYFLNYYGYSLNQKIQTELENGFSQKPFTGTVQGAFGSCSEDWVITEDTYNRLGFPESGIGYIWVDCKPENRMTLKAELNEMLSDKDHVELATYEDALKTSQFGTNMMKMLAYTFLGIMGIIGFLNMANTIIVNIAARKKELGVLQAIGMTNRQLNRMLQLEGLFFTTGTVFVAVLAGVPAGYALFAYGKSHGWIGLNIYHFPIGETVIMIAVIAVLQMILSFVLSRNIRKESLLERIRYQE